MKMLRLGPLVHESIQTHRRHCVFFLLLPVTTHKQIRTNHDDKPSGHLFVFVERPSLKLTMP